MTSPGTIRELSLGTTLQYAIGGTFMPLLIIFFRDRGLSWGQIQQVYVGISVATAACTLVWGTLADRWVPVNRLIVLLHLAGAASLVFLSGQDSFPGVCLGIWLWFALSMPTSSLFNALSYHNLTEPRTEFGKVRLWGSIGWMLPAFVVWAWMRRGGERELDLGSVLLLAAGIELLFLGLAPWLPHTPPRGAPGMDEVPFGEALRRLLAIPAFFLLLGVIFFMFWSFSVAFYYGPAQLERIGVAREWLLPIQSIGPLVEIPLFFSLRRIIGRIGPFATLSLGCSLMILRQLLFAGEAGVVGLTLSYVLLGASVVLYLIPVSIVVDEMAPRGVRATAQAFLLLCGPGLGTLIGHLHAGGVAGESRGDLQGVFVGGLLSALLGLLLLQGVAFLERRRGASRS